MTESFSLLANVELGLKNKIISFNNDRSKITYHCSRDFTVSFKDPEEKVRVSSFVELVTEYNYPPKKIDFEVTVPRRTPSDLADIVVFEDNELKKPYLVVECKKDGISDSEFKQAIEQAFGNANSLGSKFASVTYGAGKRSFDVSGFKPRERKKNIISDIPKKYGKTPKFRFIKGASNNELKIVSGDLLIQVWDKSHDTIWQGGKFTPETAFDEFTKLLFCKLKDEKETIRNDPYKFQIGTHESADDVFNRINSIYKSAKSDDPDIFKDDIRLKPKVVYSVVEHLQLLSINKIDLDAKGDAFERFMQDLFLKKMGQYFTPRNIVKFCIDMLQPSMKDMILDPACGSGGFLLYSLDSVIEFTKKHYDEHEANSHWRTFAMNNLFGIEISDQIARICKMNMVVHDVGHHSNIVNTDALDDFSNLSGLNKTCVKDKFDLLLTNPPFGAKIKSSEKDYFKSFKIKKKKKTEKSEILFIERCIDFVKPKTGKIGIILPDGILTNSSLQYVRDFIKEHCQILAIVSLPSFAFSPYGAGVKSSILFLRKKDPSETLNDYDIFMASADHIGYDATGRITSKNDLDVINKKYHKFLESN